MDNKELISREVLKALQQGNLKKDVCFAILKEINAPKEEKDIAVVGMSCKLPLAENIYEYWDNLVNGKNAICFMPDDRRKLAGIHEDVDLPIKAGFISDIDMFDADFFEITDEEALTMNPNQRMILEKTCEALEDAGYTLEDMKGSDTGVYFGIDTYDQIDYGKAHENVSVKELINADETASNQHVYSFGSMPSIMVSRLSYILDLRGPSMAIDSLCSSGLSSVHMACLAIKSGECSMAIAGGISLLDYTQPRLMPKQIGGGGDVSAFDNNSKGIMWSEGCGVILLKSFEQAKKDGDHIYAVIKGSAINNDGRTSSLTTLNAKSETLVITKAWERANIKPENISYIEAHATGTLLGDCIELKGMKDAFEQYTNKKQFCAIGSVKPSIGHGLATSGVASLLKVILSLKNEKMVPTIHFEEPNRLFEFEQSPCYINDSVKEWKRGPEPRLAGVNAYSFSRTNCHVVLEEAPEQVIEKPKKNAYIYTLSAKNKTSLLGNAKKQFEYLSKNQDFCIRDICYTMAAGRDHYEYRKAFPVRNIDDLLKQLQLFIEKIETNQMDLFSSNEINLSKQELRKIRKDYTEKANDVLLKIEENQEDQELFNTLCEYYHKGAVVDWNVLFSGETCIKLSLPTYAFNRKHYWNYTPTFQYGYDNSTTSSQNNSDTRDCLNDQHTLNSQNEEDAKNVSNDYKSAELMEQPSKEFEEQLLEQYKLMDVIVVGREDEKYSEMEMEIAKLYAALLNLEEIDISESFTMLGGDSMKAIWVINAISKVYKVNVDVVDLLMNGSVEDIAACIGNTNYHDSSDETFMKKYYVDEEYYPLSHAQERLWFISLMEENTIAYNLPIRIELGDINPDFIKEAIYEVVQRHESLRSIIFEENETAYQKVLPFETFDLPIIDLSKEDKNEERFEELIEKENNETFDMSKMMFKFKLIKLHQQQYWLYCNFHHIIIDGLSINIVMDELIQVYEKLSNKEDKKLPELKWQYRDYVGYMDEWMNSNNASETLDYWVNELQKPLPVLNMPQDYQRPELKTYRGKEIYFSLTKEESIQLKDFCKKNNVTVHIALLTAYFAMLHEVSKEKDLIIGVPINGRFNRSLEKIVGMMVNNIAIRINMDTVNSFSELLIQVKEKSLKAYKNGKYPFDLIINEIQPERDASRTPVYSTMFQYFITRPADNKNVTQFDLDLVFWENELLEGRISYNKDLFTDDTANWFILYMKNVIRIMLKNVEENPKECTILSEEEVQKIVDEFPNSVMAAKQWLNENDYGLNTDEFASILDLL